jgi:hypothetical protein
MGKSAEKFDLRIQIPPTIIAIIFFFFRSKNECPVIESGLFCLKSQRRKVFWQAPEFNPRE